MDEHILGSVRERVEAVVGQVTKLRQRLHSEPEIGLDTVRTAERIRSDLAATSLDVWEPLLGNDVIGELNGRSDRTVCLRADIDALPLQEESDLAYKSKPAGLMHACGHDGHAAMLAGAVLVLDSLQAHLRVNVRFVFQPGEEVICAGKMLVARGACDNCEAAYAIHGWPGLPAGCVSTREGPLFAAGGHFVIRVKGKACHGALPEKGNNPIPAAARIVERLHRMHVEMNALDGTVISCCAFHSGNGSNVIPDAAVVRGTARWVRAKTGDAVEKAIRDLGQQVAGETRTGVEVDYDRSYDLPVVNTKKGCRLVRQLAEDHLPAGAWREAAHINMTMEDFAYYLKGREGAMILLGLGEAAPELHSPSFDFNDDVLGTGILILCLIALSS